MQVLLTTRENNLESYHLLFACEEKWFLTQGNKYRRWRLKFYLLSKSHYRLFYSLATLYQRDTYMLFGLSPLTHSPTGTISPFLFAINHRKSCSKRHLKNIILLNIDLCACVCACVRVCVLMNNKAI